MRPITNDMAHSPAKQSKSKSTDSAIPAAAVPVDYKALKSMLSYNVRRAQITLWREFTRNEATRNVRPGVFSVLLMANANPGLAQIQIANELGIDKASVVALIDRMEGMGWVMRKRSTEDRRRQGIFLTEQGADAMRTIRRAVSLHEKKFSSRFTDQERAQLISLLQRLHD